MEGFNYDHYAARVCVKQSPGGMVLKDMQNEIDGMDYDAYDHGINIGHPDSGVGVNNVVSTQWNALGRDNYYQVVIYGGHQNKWDPNHVDWESDPILYSDNVTGTWLEENGLYSVSGNPPDVPDISQWIPDTWYTSNPGSRDAPYGGVPEPTQDLLCLIGIGILLLRRKDIYIRY